MRKKILSIVLCLCMVLTLLPTVALAADYPNGWDNSQTYSDGDTITIDDVEYTYNSDVSTAVLDLSTAPTVNTVWKAGTGTVTFTPANNTTVPATNAKLIFDGATISTDQNAVILPNEAVDVSFRGTNSISTSTSLNSERNAFSATGAVTFMLEEGSTTTLTARCKNSKVINSTGDITINGSGGLNLKPMVNPSTDENFSYAIYTTGDVAINGGSVCEQRAASEALTNNKLGSGGIVAGTVTLDAVTIPAGGTLDLHNATNAEFSADNHVTNNGTLIMPNNTDWTDVPTSISGVVVINGGYKKAVDGAWVQDVTTTGLDISVLNNPTVFTAGEGTITFTPAAELGGIPTLILNNATIAPTDANKYDPSFGAALVLGEGADIKLVLEGSSTLKGFDKPAMCGDTDGKACGAVTIGGSGSLTLNWSYSNNGSFYAGSLTLTGSATVTSPNGTVTGEVKVDPGATLTAVLKVGYPSQRTVYGSITIPESEQSSYSSPLAWADGSGMEVNGLLTLAKGTEFDDNLKSHITGSGIVRIVTGLNQNNEPNEWAAYYTDGTPVLHRSNGLNFTIDEGTEGSYWKPDATLAEDGYTFTGSAENGYVLTLGDLVIVSEVADIPTINLPMDGKVEVKLVGDTRVYTTAFAMYFGRIDAEYPCTISGSGSLLMVTLPHPAVLNAGQPLTITGGDITAINNSRTGCGVKALNLSITGGTLTAIGGSGAFSTAPAFSGYTPRTTYGADADSATTKRSPADTVYTTNKFVKIEKYIAPSVVSTCTLSFETNGGSEVSSISKTGDTIVDLTTYKPTKTGYDFDGWYSDSSLATKVTSIKLTKNTTVYAKWTAKTVTPDMPFVDVPEDAYYKDAVIWAVDEGITEGTSATTFSPDGICTRAQAVTFLWRASGSPAPKTTAMPFDDIPVGSYYYDAVLWAVEQGIIKGTSETTFSPDMNCSRAHIVTMLWRMEGAKTATAANPFADVSGTAYYADAVLWAVDEEITVGTSATTFSPDDSCNRAQIVTFIYRDMK